VPPPAEAPLTLLISPGSAAAMVAPTPSLGSARMLRVASYPSITGIWQSIRIAS
jgi:hypothetical protein